LKHDNILFDGSNYWLIDFGWCCKKDSENLDKLPSHLKKEVGLNLIEQLKSKLKPRRITMQNNLAGLRYAGSNVNAGHLYATIPIEGLDQEKAHRKDSYERIKVIKTFFRQRFPGAAKRRILDVGSAGGAMTLPLVYLEKNAKSTFAEKVVGIDHDKDMVKLVQGIAKELGVEDKTHYVGSPVDAKIIAKLLDEHEINSVICTSVYMWIVKALGIEEAPKVLKVISEKAKCMVFECSIGDGMAGDVMKAHGLTSTEKLIEHVTENSDFDRHRVLGKTKGWLGRDLIGFWKSKK
jgi:SAM-dependent methyltransferase